MMGRTTLLCIVLAATLSLVLFLVKYEVKNLERALAGLDRAIAAERQAIHVLRAEWSHLNNPERLLGLATRHLGLVPLDPEQMRALSWLPVRATAEAAGAAPPWPPTLTGGAAKR